MPSWRGRGANEEAQRLGVSWLDARLLPRRRVRGFCGVPHPTGATKDVRAPRPGPARTRAVSLHARRTRSSSLAPTRDVGRNAATLWVETPPSSWQPAAR